MSALPPEADMLIVGINVCYMPSADQRLISRANATKRMWPVSVPAAPFRWLAA